MWQKIKPWRARVTVQQKSIVAINLTLLIILKASVQTFDVKSSRVVNVSRHGTGRGKSGSEKVLRIRRTVTSKKRGGKRRRGVGWSPHTLYRATTGRGLDDLGQAGIHPTFSPTLRVPRIGVFPLDLTPCSKSYSHRRPTCPSSFHHCQPPPLPSRKILFLLPQKAALIFRQ